VEFTLFKQEINNIHIELGHFRQDKEKVNSASTKPVVVENPDYDSKLRKMEQKMEGITTKITDLEKELTNLPKGGKGELDSVQFKEFQLQFKDLQHELKAHDDLLTKLQRVIDMIELVIYLLFLSRIFWRKLITVSTKLT
jgi:chromosome segregation ATPase